MKHLTSLFLGDNHLTRFPSLQNLESLTILDLSNNTTLTDIDQDILQLANFCSVDLDGISLPPDIHDWLQINTTQDGYNGPQISHNLGRVYPDDVTEEELTFRSFS